MKKNKIRKIEVSRNANGDVISISFYFVGNDTPYDMIEFREHSKTRKLLEDIVIAIEECGL